MPYTNVVWQWENGRVRVRHLPFFLRKRESLRIKHRIDRQIVLANKPAVQNGL